MARHDNAGRFKVDDAVSIGMAQMHGFLQHQDQAMRIPLEEPAYRSGVVHHEIVGGAALGADYLAIQRGVEGSVGQLAYRVMAGADGSDDQRHDSGYRATNLDHE